MPWPDRRDPVPKSSSPADYCINLAALDREATTEAPIMAEKNSRTWRRMHLPPSQATCTERSRSRSTHMQKQQMPATDQYPSQLDWQNQRRKKQPEGPTPHTRPRQKSLTRRLQKRSTNA